MATKNNPLSRRDDLVVQELNGEVLIYDLKTNKAFCLNETAARVWQACDGSNTISDISALVGSDDVAWLAISDLKKQKLVSHAVPAPGKFDGMSRRTVIRNIALGAAVTLPVVASLVAPAAAHAQSACGATCANSNDCMNINCATCAGGTMTCVA